ncbi:alpha/beta fold hydrolase [Hydrogenophaga sp.]|uniref:alpha/beta fold hydrolase n=1 Tax=Hydrogenophaga sp. TaxID=1904254 RepID=UPI002715E413|nr:alpha/beta hydrolase [Hydrogenophaga sp.]MDO9437002.1 alpha/beta hydrolase [Hydrogenophaga sp.]
MNSIDIEQGVHIAYELDDFTDPWTQPEAVVFLHGLAEGSVAWKRWVPHFARRYHCYSMDQRGFGKSSSISADFPWSIDLQADDLATFARRLNIAKFHLVAAKAGGTSAIRFASRYPGMLKTLSLVSAPVDMEKSLGERIPTWAAMIRASGTLREYITTSMNNRLGSSVSTQAKAWWSEMMISTPADTMLSVFSSLRSADVRADLEKIQCPTFIVTTSGNLLGSVEDFKSMQQSISQAKLHVVETDSFHPAASHPDECAEQVALFIAAH